MHNLHSKTKNQSQTIERPWTWYKAWTTALLHPNEDTAKALVSEGNITFKHAYIWIVVASILMGLINSITFYDTIGYAMMHLMVGFLYLFQK